MRKKLKFEILNLMSEVLDQKTAEIIADTQELKKTIWGENPNDFANSQAEEANETPATWDGKDLPQNKRAEILRKAEELINGDRAQTYGPPEVSFGRIADILNAMGYRHHTQIEGAQAGYTRAEQLDAVDAALVLLGMKLSRTVGNVNHMDNWVDLAGYAGLGAELASPKWNLLDSLVEGVTDDLTVIENGENSQ